jgi:hypothetical protein
MKRVSTCGFGSASLQIRTCAFLAPPHSIGFSPLEDEAGVVAGTNDRNLVDPASSHMLVSKIKPCMSQYNLFHGKTANGSLKQL